MIKVQIYQISKIGKPNILYYNHNIKSNKKKFGVSNIQNKQTKYISY